MTLSDEQCRAIADPVYRRWDGHCIKRDHDLIRAAYAAAGAAAHDASAEPVDKSPNSQGSPVDKTRISQGEPQTTVCPANGYREHAWKTRVGEGMDIHGVPRVESYLQCAWCHETREHAHAPAPAATSEIDALVARFANTGTPRPWHRAGIALPGTPDEHCTIWSAAPEGYQSGDMVAQYVTIADADLIIDAVNTTPELAKAIGALTKLASSNLAAMKDGTDALNKAQSVIAALKTRAETAERKCEALARDAERLMAAVQPVANHGTCSSPDDIVNLARTYSDIRAAARAAARATVSGKEGE